MPQTAARFEVPTMKLTSFPLVILLCLVACDGGGSDGSSTNGNSGGESAKTTKGGASRPEPNKPFFTDETKARGIDFVHSTGKSGKRFTTAEAARSAAKVSRGGRWCSARWVVPCSKLPRSLMP